MQLRELTSQTCFYTLGRSFGLYFICRLDDKKLLSINAMASTLKPLLALLLLVTSTSCSILHGTDSPMEFNVSMQNMKAFEYEHSNANPDCRYYEPHHEFFLLQNGSLLIPGSDVVHEIDTYYLANDTVFLCAEEKETMTESLVHDLSEEFLTCGHILIHPHEFRLLNNSHVYIHIYKRDYGPRDYYLTTNGVYVCLPAFDEMKRNRSDESHTLDKFPPEFTYVTYAGLAISIISLLSHLVVFCLVSSARNLPGCCLASLSASLLMAYVCFLAVALMDTTKQSCADLGMCVYYFFLTSFFWMNIIAFDVWRSFRSVMRELRISSHRVPWRRFLLYSLYAWAVPALLVATVKTLDSSSTVVPWDLKPRFGTEGMCWFGSRKALLVFFAVPLVLVMVLNAAFFLDVTCVISRATIKTSHEATLRKRFFMFMRLALIMGLTWIIGLVAGYADHVSLWYGFIVLNTLQGLFIFVVFSCSSKVKGLLQVCRCRQMHDPNKRGSTSVRISHISAQSNFGKWFELKISAKGNQNEDTI
ncbi:hypothetical protein JTE90_016128 [Oedothorax gibbosus]|uniref:G-protein coupled receptors family 2 profile 2 domain-containing protein n=1 Tax=Oedothorax gibbosus TaxID=931172 RepID=A0AAV6U6V1_9ARAC|nr:hypothetical protein JTE90_016128 [Oedothorax gibbosus]